MSTTLQTKDLMVGDWIYAIDDDGNKHPCRANCLKHDYENNTDDFCVDFYGTDYEAEWPDVMFDSEPIPLTATILHKNFPNPDTGIDWWPCNYPSKVEYYHISYNNGYELDMDICYVHQLQHILRLIGDNADIEL